MRALIQRGSVTAALGRLLVLPVAATMVLGGAIAGEPVSPADAADDAPDELVDIGIYTAWVGYPDSRPAGIEFLVTLAVDGEVLVTYTRDYTLPDGGWAPGGWIGHEHDLIPIGTEYVVTHEYVSEGWALTECGEEVYTYGHASYTGVGTFVATETGRHFVCYEPVEDVPAFSDVPEDHPFIAEIEWLADQGITTGYHDGTFQPGTTVSRQAAAAFFHRYADQPTFTPPTTPTFTDVPTTHPFFTEIEWLADTGITTGYDDNTFRPGTTVTRQATAAFFHRYDQLP